MEGFMVKYITAIALLAGACASAPGESTDVTARPSGTVFTYATPTPAIAQYRFSDSSAVNVQAGAMGEIRATIGSTGTLETTFVQKPTGLETTIRIVSLGGSMTNSAMGGGPSATQADVEGVAVVNVSPRGVPSIVSLPKMSPAVQQIGINTGFFRRLFVRLPQGGVTAGSSWVDTITVQDENEGTKVVVTDVVTTTFVRDTVVNGRAVALLNTNVHRDLSVAGTTQGVQIAQKLTGTAMGQVLWDTKNHLLIERTETSQLTGTFDLPAMGQTGMPVAMKSNNRISIK
jgi:hypothetical protein